MKKISTEEGEITTRIHFVKIVVLYISYNLISCSFQIFVVLNKLFKITSCFLCFEYLFYTLDIYGQLNRLHNSQKFCHLFPKKHVCFFFIQANPLTILLIDYCVARGPSTDRQHVIRIMNIYS